jgi:hypothetical protein
MTGIGQGPSLMIRISIATGVIGSARPASAEKLTSHVPLRAATPAGSKT